MHSLFFFSFCFCYFLFSLLEKKPNFFLFVSSIVKDLMRNLISPGMSRQFLFDCWSLTIWRVLIDTTCMCDTSPCLETGRTCPCVFLAWVKLIFFCKRGQVLLGIRYKHNCYSLSCCSVPKDLVNIVFWQLVERLKWSLITLLGDFRDDAITNKLF